MKRWLLRIIIVALLGAAGYWLLAVLFPNPERVIRKRFSEIAQLASFSAKEAPLAKLMNTQKLAGYFSPDVEIVIDVPGRFQGSLAGREELVGAVTRARNTLTALNVDFPDVVVTVGPDRQSAIGNVTVAAKIAGERDLFVQELKCLLRKASGSWLITRVEAVKTLR